MQSSSKCAHALSAGHIIYTGIIITAYVYLSPLMQRRYDSYKSNLQPLLTNTLYWYFKDISIPYSIFSTSKLFTAIEGVDSIPLVANVASLTSWG